MWTNPPNALEIANVENLEVLLFTKEQWTNIISSWVKLRNNPSLSHLAQTSNFLITTLYTSKSNSHIIDLRVTNHMTSLYSIFISYIPCFSYQKVKTTNRILSSIIGQWFIKILYNLGSKFYYMSLIFHATVNLWVNWSMT